MAGIEGQTEEDTIWDKPEAFMLEISKVPLIKQKLAIWMFQFDFEDNFEGIELPTSKLKEV